MWPSFLQETLDAAQNDAQLVVFFGLLLHTSQPVKDTLPRSLMQTHVLVACLKYRNVCRPSGDLLERREGMTLHELE